jgi:alkanesulfonate monooxygenase SsuD/methylene tetrahydromethanopterin reductase-like flavin-dependent oxidoreductase (luciferase family)
VVHVQGVHRGDGNTASGTRFECVQPVGIASLTISIHFGYNPPSGDRRLEPVRAASYRDDLDRVLNVVEPSFDSVWISDHFMTAERFRLEAWTLLTWIASRRPSLDLGTIVLGASYRHPPLLAKMAASLQHLMDGRLIFGYGAGWAEDEYRAYGYEYPPARKRIEQLDEALTVIKALWAGGPVDYDGRWFRLQGAICEPHWWNGLHHPLPVLRQRMEQLDRACEAVGRDPVTLRRSAYLTVFLDRDAQRARRAAGDRLEGEAPPFAGDPSGLIDHLATLERIGIDACQLVFAGFPATDDIELFVERVLPAFRSSSAADPERQ